MPQREVGSIRLLGTMNMKVTMNNEIEYIYGGMELFTDTVPLRLRLLEHHSRMSQHFASYYSPARIEGTKQFLVECNARDSLHIGLARHIPTGRNVGFCISTVNAENVGEIFAIWVEDGFKNLAIGTALSEKALVWLRSMNPKHLEIHILFENAKVRSFYERLGFFPQTILLREMKTTVDSTPGGNDREPDHGVQVNLINSAS
jgi:ribosomal protein S18 acetylase RimI-like enzyme